MIRNAPRRRVLFAVVIALVGLLAAPIDECDDYAFFRPGTVSARAEPPAAECGDSEPTHGGGHPGPHLCSCLVCVLTTDDSFVPSLPPPQRGELVAASPAVPCCSTYLPAIFRPPIA